MKKKVFEGRFQLVLFFCDGVLETYAAFGDGLWLLAFGMDSVHLDV